MTQAARRDPSVIQFRMSHIQLVNWGSFHGYHALDIHPGGTLLTGPSGTGKSTLLDGAMTVLMDRTMAFNAAAHDEGPRRERTFHTYMRGKVGDRDTAHGKIPLYLREGAAWSAIAVTWTNAAGASVTGCRALFITRAGAGNSDIIHCLLITEAAFDACDLQAASADHLRKDAVRAAVPGAMVFGDDYGAYIARLTGLLGIRGRAATAGRRSGCCTRPSPAEESTTSTSCSRPSSWMSPVFWNGETQLSKGTRTSHRATGKWSPPVTSSPTSPPARDLGVPPEFRHGYHLLQQLDRHCPKN